MYILGQRKRSEKSEAAVRLITASLAKSETLSAGMVAARTSRARLFPVFIPNTSRPSYQRAVVLPSLSPTYGYAYPRRKGKGNGARAQIVRSSNKRLNLQG